ncbi:MAG: tyrosine/phenylalanine carboxypeptidase domain-containing protein [Candidatus Absconditabacterales bacterium]
MLDFGILGNNARNLLYIKKFNDKKGIRLANNKLQTKDFLIERGIPFAKTYGIISHRKELYEFDFAYLPKKNFVVKPNHGSKGQGVYIVKYVEEEHSEEIIDPAANDGAGKEKKSKTKRIFQKRGKQIKKIFFQKFTDRHHHGMYQIGETLITDEEFRRHLLDILDGKYSMTLGGDKIIIEEKLVAGELFKDFCEYGLADIRVIVFNLVPVATMIRMPTKVSGGKANLAQGGLGFGIEVGSGKITSLLWKNKIYKIKFPKKFAHFQNKKIPYWNDILFLSSKVQYFVNLGYLALDRVITNEGPKLLEINARAGLEVQKVSDIKLKNILNKIADLKITDPEKGVEIAKSLFTPEKSDLLGQNKLLYLSQYAKFIIKEKEEEEKIDVIVEVDLNKSGNYMSQKLFEKIKENKREWYLDLYENEITLKKAKFSNMESLADNKIILGNKTASRYLIKPIHKTFAAVDIIDPKYIQPLETAELHAIDQKIEKLNKRLNLSSRLRPLNYFSELDKFITLHGKYNPIFKYKRPEEQKLIQTKEEIIKLQEQLKKLKSVFKNVFLEKLEELELRRNLILAYSKQDFDNIALYNRKLFGEFDDELLKIAKEKVFSIKEDNQKLLGEPLTLSTIEKTIEKYLAEKKIYGVDIVFSYTNLSRISVIMGKEIKISISKHGVFREKELLSILAHEIDTHLVRYLNGLKSGRNILKSGTGYYLKDEEGLAIYNASKILPKEYEKDSIYKKYFITKEAERFDFKKTIELLKFLYPERSLEGHFKAALKVKKGIIDTSTIHIGTTMIKNKIYLEGYTTIKTWAEHGFFKDAIYKGKVKIQDLSFIL